ncbi:hypothetical protein tb265_31150 [Gemmatimonadetes bacterium T265]|nr:hypothetical protein tb265_31150 [Gemmatimonadetes bacterium T265]
MTRVTALIPCYNGERYIAGAVGSVRAQTRPVDEIIVVDDCSTDRSADVARDAGATVITLSENAGPSRARNVGLARASGDLVAFLDADDRWTPAHCALTVGLLERTPEAVLAFGRSALIQFPTLRSSDGLPSGKAVDALNEVLRLNPVTQSAVVLRRAAALTAGGYDERMRYSEDYDLWLRLALVGPFICTHQITCWREAHPAQASRNALPLRRGAWAARARTLDAVRRTGDRPRQRAAERAAVAAWRYELRDGWRSEFTANLDSALAMRAEVGLPPAPYWTAMIARHVLWWPRQLTRDLWRRVRGTQLPDASLIS